MVDHKPNFFKLKAGQIPDKNQLSSQLFATLKEKKTTVEGDENHHICTRFIPEGEFMNVRCGFSA